MQQLQLGVKMGTIHPSILNLPLTDQILQSIRQLLNLQQMYLNLSEQLQQHQRLPPHSISAAAQHNMDSLQQKMAQYYQQMKRMQQILMHQAQSTSAMPSQV